MKKVKLNVKGMQSDAKKSAASGGNNNFVDALRRFDPGSTVILVPPPLPLMDGKVYVRADDHFVSFINPEQRGPLICLGHDNVEIWSEPVQESLAKINEFRRAKGKEEVNIDPSDGCPICEAIAQVPGPMSSLGTRLNETQVKRSKRSKKWILPYIPVSFAPALADGRKSNKRPEPVDDSQVRPWLGPVSPQAFEVITSVVTQIVTEHEVDPTDPDAMWPIRVMKYKGKNNIWEYTAEIDGSMLTKGPTKISDGLRESINTLYRQGGQLDPYRFIASQLKSYETVKDILLAGSPDVREVAEEEYEDTGNDADEVSDDEIPSFTQASKAAFGKKSDAGPRPDTTPKNAPAEPPVPEPDSTEKAGIPASDFSEILRRRRENRS